MDRYQQNRSVNIAEAGAQVPTDLQSRYSKTIQTHNAASVGASALTTRVEVNTKGYSEGLLMHSATGNAQARVQAVLSNGAIIDTANLAITSSRTKDVVTVNLKGIEKISVYGTDTSGATNAITIELSLIV